MNKELVKRLEDIEDGTLLEDVEVKKQKFPLLFLHRCGIFVFLEDGDFTENRREILDKIYVLQSVLSVTRGKMWIYSYSEESGAWTWMNPFTDEVTAVEDLSAHVMSCIEAGMYNFEDARLSYFADKLSFGQSTGGQRVRTDSQGITYVKRGSHWFQASDEDTEEVFRKTCLFGIFGWFQFHTGRFFSGVAYLLTCGFFGFGYMFDILHFLLGFARDRDGYYYVPLEDKRRPWIMFLVCTAAAMVLMFIYMKGLGVLNDFVASLFSSHIDTQTIEQGMDILQQ